MEKLPFFCNGEYVESQTKKYHEVYNPSTGEATALCPCCTREELEMCIQAAKAAFPAWANTPPMKRAQVLYRIRELLVEHMDELTLLVAQENGKVWEEARGDVLKAKEPTELACSIPTLMMGESLMDASRGIDTVLYREPIGVFAGIVPFNFPAMIPMGWMSPLCIASGNCMVLKVSSTTPRTALRLAALYKEAGVPDGVLNVISCSRIEAGLLLTHPDVKGISFVGTTAVGKEIYSVAATHGKRVQALCEAKNHALVLEDCNLDQTAGGIINAAFGCAGERCMALPVVCVQESIANALVKKLVMLAKGLTVGPSWIKTSRLGPVISEKHRQEILGWIDRGLEEGASLVLDGRNVVVKGYEKGFYLGPSIFDHVGPDTTVGNREIFGPVLCIKRVKDFEEGIAVMNRNPFANGSVIFTQSGYYAREFQKRTHGGMVGVNVGIPVPISIFPFSGHKNSFFGDLHCQGKDAIRFYTDEKCVTTRWFDKTDTPAAPVSTWDGTI